MFAVDASTWDRCDLAWRAYLRRFDIEHTFRFAKSTLGWTTPSLRTPEQADRWTWLITAAYTQLRLARSAVEDLRLPWQRPRVPSPRTPARVRRGFRPPQAGPHLLEGQPAEGRLVAALASDAELLVLDEPTSGLDPLMNSVFQDCIREVKAEGRTVLLSSRILAEVEALCDRVSIVRAGRTIQAGTLAELRELTRTAVAAETVASPSGLERLPGVHGLDVDDHHVRFDVDTAQLDAAMRRLAKLGIRSLVSQPPTLGELFLRHYGDELAGEAAAAAAAGR